MTSPSSAVRTHRVVGVIGGMGPEATVDLMRRVIAKTPAEDDQDHIHLIVESNPKIPSRIKHLIEGTGEDPTSELIRIAQNLERAGADALAIPCNTAHAYAAAIVDAVSIPLLDMVQATVNEIGSRHAGACVGLLASSAVHKLRVFETALAAAGLATVLPPRQAAVMELISAVKRGRTGADVQQALGALARDFARQADVLVIGCSELSVISGGIDVPFVDSLDVLADKIVRFAGVAA